MTGTSHGVLMKTSSEDFRSLLNVQRLAVVISKRQLPGRLSALHVEISTSGRLSTQYSLTAIHQQPSPISSRSVEVGPLKAK